MATKYTVRAITAGTGINLAVSASNPQVALDKVQRSKLGRRASCYIVFERKTGTQVAIGVNRQYAPWR